MTDKLSTGFFQNDKNQAAQSTDAEQSNPAEQETGKWGKVINMYEKAPALKLAKVIPMFR